MSDLGNILDDERDRQRVLAIRHLLHRPLILTSTMPEVFSCIVRHREWLHSWFSDHPGWKLAVDPGAGFARLYKVPARADATRGARLVGRPAFDRRRYVLLCLTLAALDDGPAQTTLAKLAGLVEELSVADREAIAPFDPTSQAERRAFVEVLRWLSELGVLRIRDGDTDRYAQSREEGDALYDVNDRLLSHLVGSPVPPAFAGSPARLLDEHLPDTDEGIRQRSRNHVMRRLLEDPVVYYDELAQQAGAFEWLDHSRGHLYALLERDVGLSVERRKEGLAAVDPAGELSDALFPDSGSTLKHAALLLAEQLCEIARGGRSVVSMDEIVRLTAALQADFGEVCHWSRGYPANEAGSRQLAADVIELLESFAMVSVEDSSKLRVRPAIARFRPTEPVAGASKHSRRAFRSVQKGTP